MALFAGRIDWATGTDFSLQGNRVATKSKTTRIWSTSDRLLAELKGHKGVVYDAHFKRFAALASFADQRSTLSRS